MTVHDAITRLVGLVVLLSPTEAMELLEVVERWVKRRRASKRLLDACTEDRG